MRSAQGVAGVALVAVGVALLAVVGAYYGYAAFARAQLDDLNYSIETTAPLPHDLLRDGFGPSEVAPPVAPAASQVSSRVAVSPAPEVQPVSLTALADAPVDAPAPPVLPSSSYDSLYPGFQIHPKYWDQPLWAGTDSYSYLDTSLPDGFQPVLNQRIRPPAGVAAVANRIEIPLLGVESVVNELQILDLENSRSYETPKNVVGHIPSTANPSETGNGWYFGHLESPLRGEGNVFSQLPEIPGLLKDGDPVYVTINSGDGDFLYQVTETQVVYQDDLRLYDSDGAEITLVACVPRLVYDHRLVVTAKLVGTRK
jgi:LPXTG-site transpeptidase (sortase) family protein